MRGQPLPVELHNTLYAVRGRSVDGLSNATALRAWLVAMAPQLPVDVKRADAALLHEVLALRVAVRDALHAAIDVRPPTAAARRALNQLSADGRTWVELTPAGLAETKLAPTPAAALLGAIAAETIALVGGELAANLRRCGAPGCVLVFLKEHPHRRWCSDACGNRARQARHYERTHRA